LELNSFGNNRSDLALHPTVKPVALVTDAIRDCSHRKGIVLDAFAGSGTTLIAAERVGRRGYGIESTRYIVTSLSAGCAVREQHVTQTAFAECHDMISAFPGSIRSAVRHTHFAMVSEETSDDLEYRWTEPDAGIFCRRRHHGPRSSNEGFAPSRKLE
jgi:hypothetical protein